MSDADFPRAIAFLWPDEGSAVVDDPDDAGGISHFGLSLRDNPELGRDGIIALTRDGASQIYLRKWWAPYRYGLLAWPASGKLFDLAVNIGPKIACRMLQGACNDVGVFPSIKVYDGILGPATAAAAAWCLANKAPELHETWVSLAESHYRLIVNDHPEDAKFLKGWIARADRWPA